MFIKQSKTSLQASKEEQRRSRNRQYGGRRFCQRFNESGETLIEELLAERYEPQAEKQFEIPKPKGVDSCYADDFVIFVRSQKAGERVKESVIRFIKDNLQLKISEAKSKVCNIEESTFLGHTILGNGMLVIAKGNILRLKMKVRKITQRTRGRSFE